MKILICNIGWMKDYQGMNQDKIVGGGAYVQKHGVGHEIYNFKPYKGRMYGWVQPTGGTIIINRLGAKDSDKCVNNILVIWVSKEPKGGVFIVGWYKHATVYKVWQPAPKGSKRTYKKDELGYNISAKKENCKLLVSEDRVFQVPRGRLGMGQSNVWYADKKKHTQFRQKLLKYLDTGKVINKKHIDRPPISWQADLSKRIEVEKRAIKRTAQYYESRGYEVNSVEKEKKGWDLEAKLNNKTLKLEVKGLSGKEIYAELTSNEYRQMLKDMFNYRICIVTDVLGKSPVLNKFEFSPEDELWVNDTGKHLKIEIVKSISARLMM